MPSVPVEEVHQRAGQQEQIWPVACDVRPMLSDQEECTDQPKHDRCSDQLFAVTSGGRSIRMLCDVAMLHGVLQKVRRRLVNLAKTIRLYTVGMSTVSGGRR